MVSRKVNKWLGIFLMAAGIILVASGIILTFLNLREDRLAGKNAMKNLPLVIEAIEEAKADAPTVKIGDTEYPAYVGNPEMEMPVKVIDGVEYVGYISIPSQEIDLPVIAEFSYKDLNIAPTRLVGSAYLNNMTICGHNYMTHFYPIRNLESGDLVIFTDMDGNEFRYLVAAMETLGGYEYEEMVDNDYDLTLFTCTFDSRSRVTVRCVQEDENVIWTEK